MTQDRTSSIATVPSVAQPAEAPIRNVIRRFPAGGPFGNKPAEAFAAEQRAQGRQARVVMDLPTDNFLVIDDAQAVSA